MNLSNAAGLLWLIPPAGAIVLLYLLKMRRRDLKVPATFLWPPLTYEVRANSLFQRLRLSWLLFLQLLAVLLIVLGFARPQVSRPGIGGDVTVIVIDSSASMTATDVKPSRLEAAKKAALSLVGSARVGDRLCLIEAGPNPRVASPLSTDVAQLRAALADLEPCEAESDVGSAMRLAVSLTAKQASSRIVLYSDGVFPEVRDFSAGKAKVDFQRIGNSDENVAITALGTTDTSSGRLLYCGLRNYGKLPALGKLTIKADGQVYNSVKVEVPGRNTFGKTMPVPAGAKVIEAFLATEDVLKCDNYAVTLTDPGAQVKVLLVGKDDLFLERALALDPRVILDKASDLPDTAEYGLVVFDGVAEKPVKSRGVLTFGSAGDPSPVTRLGASAKPKFVDAREGDPVMADVDLGGMYVAEGEKVKAKPVGNVLAESDQGPWVVSSAGAQRHIYVAFQPLKSDFPLQPAFPIFISNAIDYLVPREGASNALAVPAGRSFSIPAGDAAGRLTLVAPDGSKTTLDPLGGNFTVREVRQVGRYEMRVGDRKQAVYVSFAGEAESNIAPVDRVLIGSKEVKATQATMRLTDFWRPLLLLALFTLALEWWLYARRS